ncbi:MAG: hypothetical protein WCW27_02880 [Patescibacteria group bacterium]|jgi:hypothetical protein
MLNLLPPNKKQYIEQERLFQFVKQTCLLLVGCTVLISALLLSGRLGLTTWLNNVSTQNYSTIKTPPTAALDQLANLNKLAAKLTTMQTSYKQPVPVITTLLQNMPANVTLTNLKIDYTKNTMLVEGVAADRAALLQLSQIVNQQTLWKNVNFPIKDFAQKELIPFQFNVTLL